MSRPITLFWTSNTIFISPALLCNPLVWDTSFIGEIKDYAYFPPRTISDRIVYFSYIVNEDKRIGDYAILEKYTEEAHFVEKIKAIFNVQRREYHLCTYKSKPFFLFYCHPDYENSLTIAKIPKSDITLFHRQQIIMIWILGISSRLWRRGNNLYTRKYGEINYSKNDLKKATIKRFFPSKHELNEAMDIFKDQEKLYELQDLLEGRNYWYNLILSRIHSV